MATQAQIDAKIQEIKDALIVKGFSFGTFTPDYQALFTEVYGEQLAGVSEGSGEVDWDIVNVADMLAVLEGQISSLELTQSLQDEIAEIPDLRSIVDNVLSNVSPDWSNAETYGPGQIVNYGGFLWENINAVLVPTNDFPSLSNTDWKVVGTYNNIYNTVDNIQTQIYSVQTAADDAVSSTNILSAQLLGTGQAPGDPPIAGGIIYDYNEAIVGPEGAIVQSTTQLQTDFLGPNGDATGGGYLFDIILDSSVQGTLANTTETLQATVGDNSAAISTEAGIRAVTIGPDYESDTVYLANAVVNHLGLLYQNNTGTTVGPEPFDSDKWDQVDNSLYAEYTVKIDVNGNVAGFGLAASDTTSAFIVNAQIK